MPGDDGLTYEFYRFFWEDIGDAFVHVFNLAYLSDDPAPLTDILFFFFQVGGWLTQLEGFLAMKNNIRVDGLKTKVDYFTCKLWRLPERAASASLFLLYIE